MIIDEEKKFVFIHIPKTAGTSMRNALRPKRNIVNKLKNKSLGYDALSNAVNRITKHETYSEFIENFTTRTGLENNALNDFTFIAFVRNPVERFESLHRYLLKNHRKTYPNVPEDINAFVESIVYETDDYLKKIRSLRTQYSFIDGIDNKQIMIGRYENLLTDWNKIVRRFNITTELMHMNKTKKYNKRITEHSERLISDYFSIDFEHFGY